MIASYESDLFIANKETFRLNCYTSILKCMQLNGVLIGLGFTRFKANVLNRVLTVICNYACWLRHFVIFILPIKASPSNSVMMKNNFY